MHPTRRLLDAALEGLATAVPAGGMKVTLHTSDPASSGPAMVCLPAELVAAMRANIDRTRQAVGNALGIQAETAEQMWRSLNPGLARFYDFTRPDPETRD